MRLLGMSWLVTSSVAPEPSRSHHGAVAEMLPVTWLLGPLPTQPMDNTPMQLTVAGPRRNHTCFPLANAWVERRG